MSSTAKVIIKGEDQLSSPLKQAKGQLTGFASVTQELGKKISNAFTFTAVILAIAKLAKALGNLAIEEAETQRKYTQLKLALEDTSAYNKVTSAIDRLNRKTVASKDDLESMASELAGMGANAEGIERIMEASVALANVTGTDLNSAYSALYKSIDGTTSSLKKMGVNVDSLTESELAQGGAIDLVIEKYGELSEQVANDSVDQTIKNIGKSLDDIRGALGQTLLDTITPALETIYKWLLQIEQWVNKWADNSQITNQAKRGTLNAEDYTYGQLEAALNNFWENPRNKAYKEDFESNKDYAGWKPKGTTLQTANAIYQAMLEKQMASSSMPTISAVVVEGGSGSSVADYGKGGSETPTMTAIEEALKQYGSLSKQYQIDNLNIEIEKIKGLFETATDVEKVYLGDVITGLEEQKAELLKVETQIEKVNKTFVEKLGDAIGKKLASLTGATSEQGASAGGKVIEYLTENLGEAGQVAGELAQNMAVMGPLLGAIVTALKYVIEGFGQVVTETLNEFVEYGLEPLREIGRVIGKLILPVLENVMPLVQKSADFLIRIFDAIGVVLGPIAELLGTALAPVISMICNVLEALTPVFKVFAKVVVTVTGTIQWVCQLFQHWIAAFCNALASIKILGWRPFGGLAQSDPGSPGSYSSYIRNKWSEVDAAFDRTYTTEGSSTGTAVTNASYSGGVSVTINIYQEGVVCGDGGITQFAQILRNEFLDLNYVGR